MRQILSFECEQTPCAATLDIAASETGLLIVSGGNEIRAGAHRGMAQLSADICEKGHSVFRFDRRGIGDSAGDNGGFSESESDLAAALEAFRRACPHLKKIIGFGNCDAASALLLHPPEGLSALVLGNIWVIETTDDLPPTAAIRAHYLERLKDPQAWAGLFTGAINIKKLASGLLKLAKPQEPTTLSQQIGQGLAQFDGPVTILLANRDATALAFASAWKEAAFEHARARPDIRLVSLDSASHSFASADDYAMLVSSLLAALKAETKAQ
jgi:exosortase A-associated hydrolase 1